MRNTDYFRNKKIAIVGLARSGLACANLLYESGAEVWITDSSDNENTRLSASRLISDKIKFELGSHTEAFIKGKDIVVISPGVEETALPIIWAKLYKIPIVSEIEIAWMLCPATVIAVTGSNGKTTVTTLIGKILETAGKKAFVCGNIGNPFSGEVRKMNEGDYVSLEISSFQLEAIRTFKPKISLILNFTRNHLDRYRSMDEYLQAKMRIFLNQDKDDYLILNGGDAVLKEAGRKARPKTIYFSAPAGINPNYAAVTEVGKILGIQEALCQEVFSNFRGLPHRMEMAGEVNGVRFINDSKATTVESAIMALENTTAPIVWIAGGKDKGLDYRLIRQAASDRVKELVLIGEAREKIKQALQGAVSISEAPDLEKAVTLAYQKAAPRGVVLLSPMCSSFDMFSNYEERGEVFKKIVNKFSGEVKAEDKVKGLI